MKLPFTFAAPLIFRLVLPGIFLAAGLLPMLEFMWRQIEPPIELKAVLPFFMVVLGWLITVLDQPIYTLFMGRRFWPPCIKTLYLEGEQNRLTALRRKYAAAAESNNVQLRTELALQMAAFPLATNEEIRGEREAVYPTRLGNLIAEYEEYPTIKYGVDGAFYWYRIWLNLGKDIKNELDERQAFVDGVIYLSFVFYLSAAFAFLYAMLELFVGLSLMPPTSWQLYLPLTPVLAITGYALYWLSLPAQNQYGKHFKAMFDCHYSTFDPKPVLKIIADATGNPTIALEEGPDAYRIAWRYLHWHRFRRPGTTTNVNFEEARVVRRP